MLAEHDQPQRPWLVDEAQREGNEAMGLIYQTPARIYRQSPSALVSLSLHSRHRLPPIFTIPKFGSRVTKSHRPATTFTSPASISSALMRHRSARLPFRGGFDDSTDILHGRIIEVDCEDEASSDSVPQDLRERRHRSGHWRYPHAMTDTAIIRQEDPLMAVRPSAHVIRGRHARIAQAIKQWMKENKPAQHAVTTMGTADLDTVFKLAKSGTSVNIKDDLGRTPLHIAATAGKVENVRFLIAMGADLNAMDNLGNTPLTLAATAAKFNIVLLLLENGADQSAGRAQFSPLEMARSRLRLMRAQLQAMRGMHDIHRPSVYSGDASLGSYSKRVHNRRQRLVQVARDCLEVIKLLQSFQQAAPQHRAIGRNGRTLNTLEQTYAAFDRNLSSEPAPLTGSAASELDELALKLLGLGIDSKPDKPPQSSPLAAGQTEVNVEDGQGEPAAGGDGQGTKGKEVDRSSDGAAETEEKKDSAELCDRFERDMDLVLSKLSQLMGESTDKDTTVVE
ncbi:hypothetical protein EV182_000408 [Spiromyces aspiralis]|uniref:Uncharacterized protein n=1 Tax=Spiromyces aspiralis TaxID=68401 RepID=A0ACC1HHP0_9FUNG|nr:hypothetical protein EV182_000408 [Spiromyces aspiralis]